MTINYELKFFDYWHISSGLSGGAALDRYVVKDMARLPYVPGKTIKGLVREMAELFWDQDDINECFGKQGIKKNSQIDFDDTTQAQCYFSSAVIDKSIASEITSNNLTHNLLRLFLRQKSMKMVSR